MRVGLRGICFTWVSNQNEKYILQHESIFFSSNYFTNFVLVIEKNFLLLKTKKIDQL